MLRSKRTLTSSRTCRGAICYAEGLAWIEVANSSHNVGIYREMSNTVGSIVKQFEYIIQGLCKEYMGDCQNYDPFLGPLN